MFELLTRLFRPARPAMPPRRGLPKAADPDRPLGCGWFDSSHDLLQGISVWEGIIGVDDTLASLR